MNKYFARCAAYLLMFAISTGISFAQKKSPAKQSTVLSPASNAAKATVSTPTIPLSQEYIVENLRAFTKLYGYVRYFHPSDEALRVDWNKFALYGVTKVKNAPNQEALKTTLEELFLPIAPTLQILKKGEKPKPNAVPGNITQHQVVAWQHKGMGIGVEKYGYSVYNSIRLNKDNITTGNMPDFGTITQKLGGTTATVETIAELRGKQIKLTGAMKASVNGSPNSGRFWLRVDKKGGKIGFFNDMEDRPVTANTWGEYSIIGEVDSTATAIFYGVSLKGVGKVWADDVRIYTRANAQEEWKRYPTTNPGFEEHSRSKQDTSYMIYDGWFHSPHYTFTPDTDAYMGKYCIRIQEKDQKSRSFRGELFVPRPAGGETLQKDLANGLECALPVALFTDPISTLGTTNESSQALARLLDVLNTINADSATIDDAHTRLANVVLGWNVLQHSYPYFDVVGTDWNAVLTSTLANTLKTSSGEEFIKVMRQMTEKLRDGHADYYSQMRQRLFLPIKAEILEGKLVVIASEDAALKRGDVILSIDGKDVLPIIAEEEALISGTPQWKRSQAAWKALSGASGDALVRINRGGEEMNVRAMRLFAKKVEEYPAFKQIRGTGKTDAVWYVDLSQIDMMTEFNTKLSEFAEAKGLIFDLRGYPNSNHNILRHLTDTPLRSAQWNVPQILYPDQERIAGYDTTGRWTLFPFGPRLKGKIVFLTGGGAISYAESVMGIVEHYKLGEIVGETTAGANGNVNSMRLLGNTSMRWTGMKVLKHDGSQHHLIGIKPTVPAVRTVKGVQEGRDEVLEKALSLIP